jgi:hypothetical protein
VLCAPSVERSRGGPERFSTSPDPDVISAIPRGA